MIRLTIQRKVFLATISLATTMVLVLTLVMRWNLGQGFERYTSAAELSRLDWMVAKIETEYATHGNWDFVRTAPEQFWRRMSRPNRQTRPDLNSQEQAESFPPHWQDGQMEGRPLSPSIGRVPPPPQGGRPPRDNYPPQSDQDDLPPAAAITGESQPQDPLPITAPPDPLRIVPRLTLLNVDGKRLAGNTSRLGFGAERSILFQGKVVGGLALEAVPPSVQQLDSAFLASQTKSILLAGLSALLFSLLAAWLLARHLLAPIHDLAAGARKIARGSLDTRINLRGEDELAELGENFNDMAERLGRIEESRRTWISETSHELRTPLAVLRAEIEAMQDGVRTADAATLVRLHKQVQQLAKLVDDLRLTLDREPGSADMDYEPVSPITIIQECVAAFRNRFDTAGIQLDISHLAEADWRVRGDADRLTQVFSNLLENTLRYTNAGGRLSITDRVDKHYLTLQFDDSAPAPSPMALPRLFERFFRAEPSRSRELGGSGLGLAICRTLIEAHGGRISAAPSKLGGLQITITLPLDKL